MLSFKFRRVDVYNQGVNKMRLDVRVTEGCAWLDWDTFPEAKPYTVAVIVYGSFGETYFEDWIDSDILPPQQKNRIGRFLSPGQSEPITIRNAGARIDIRVARDAVGRLVWDIDNPRVAQQLLWTRPTLAA